MIILHSCIANGNIRCTNNISCSGVEEDENHVGEKPQRKPLGNISTRVLWPACLMFCIYSNVCMRMPVIQTQFAAKSNAVFLRKEYHWSFYCTNRLGYTQWSAVATTAAGITDIYYINEGIEDFPLGWGGVWVPIPTEWTLAVCSTRRLRQLTPWNVSIAWLSLSNAYCIILKWFLLSLHYYYYFFTLFNLPSRHKHRACTKSHLYLKH